MVEEEDPRFPGGMNYLDWLMNVLSPDELTPQNLDQIIAGIRRMRAMVDSGVTPKKHQSALRVNKLLGKILKPKRKVGLLPL